MHDMGVRKNLDFASKEYIPRAKALPIFYCRFFPPYCLLSDYAGLRFVAALCADKSGAYFLLPAPET